MYKPRSLKQTPGRFFQNFFTGHHPKMATDRRFVDTCPELVCTCGLTLRTGVPSTPEQNSKAQKAGFTGPR